MGKIRSKRRTYKKTKRKTKQKTRIHRKKNGRLRRVKRSSTKTRINKKMIGGMNRLRRTTAGGRAEQCAADLDELRRQFETVRGTLEQEAETEKRIFEVALREKHKGDLAERDVVFRQGVRTIRDNAKSLDSKLFEVTKLLEECQSKMIGPQGDGVGATGVRATGVRATESDRDTDQRAVRGFTVVNPVALPLERPA